MYLAVHGRGTPYERADRAVLVHSGADASILRRIALPEATAEGSFELGSVGLILPGWSDLASGQPCLAATRGWYRRGSGGDGYVVQIGELAGSEFEPCWEIHRACSRFGRALEWMPDVDGDDHPDLLIGTVTDWGIGEGEPSDEELGVIELLSGATGSVIHRIRAREPSTWDRFGYSVCWADDTDGDGVDDYATGDPGIFLLDSRGLVRVLSGKDGRDIAHIEGEGRFRHLGAAICSIEDLDGDGFRELLIGGAAPNIETTAPGYFCVWSPAKGRVLFEQEGIASLLE